MLVGPVPDFLFCFLASGFLYHQSEGSFAPLAARYADNRSIGYRRMAEDDIFQVYSVDVETAGNNHVFPAVENMDKAVFVNAAHIAAAIKGKSVGALPRSEERRVGKECRSR